MRTCRLQLLLGLSLFFGISARIHALPSDYTLLTQALLPRIADTCQNAVNPLYLEQSGVLCLPLVTVTGASTQEFYTAQLQLVNDASAYNFSLLSAKPIASFGSNSPVFTVSTGNLTIPSVEVPETYGTNRYKVALRQIPANNFPLFSLVSIDAIISPSYQPGITWKPYVGLLPYEKSAFILLAQSRPFSELALSAYDFSIKTSGDWDLIQSISTDSGMQAGVYRNRISAELVIAFRGSEVQCLVPFDCSLQDIQESAKDLLTDTLLTQGRDSGQFNDAFNFVGSVLKNHPNTKITVTGHSLGGGLAQATGATFLLESYAFNSSPVPNNYWNDHGLNQFDSQYAKVVHVLSDVHDPVSSTNHLGLVYSDARHVSSNIQFDFDNKQIMPTYKTTLDSLRLNKHSMTKLRDNINAVVEVYRLGW